MRFSRCPVIAAALLMAVSARAEIAVVVNDNHWVLVDGVAQGAPKAGQDNVRLILLDNNYPPRVLRTALNVPGSVIGPPLSVALTPDERLILVTSSMKLDPADPSKQIEDNRVTIIRQGPVLATDVPSLEVAANLEAGKAPAGISINRAGTLALVANRGEGTVSVFTINGTTVAPAGKIGIGNAASALGHVVFTPDGKRALVTRDGDNMVTVLNVDGDKVTLAGRDIRTGLRPYAIDVTPDGAVAVLGNVGAGSGDMDTVAVIDLRAEPPRVVDVVPVGITPEGVKLSPDGKWCAVVLQNGSNFPPSNPFHSEAGKLVLFRLDGVKLTRVAEAPVGRWPQGVVFSRNGRTLLVTNMVEKNVQVFSWDGTTLRDTGQRLDMPGGPAAIRTAE